LARVIGSTGFPACADSLPPTFSEILYHSNTITNLPGSVNPSSLASLRDKKYHLAEININPFFVILNEVKDLNSWRMGDSSRRSE
jgi:hypothetical protein